MFCVLIPITCSRISLSLICSFRWRAIFLFLRIWMNNSFSCFFLAFHSSVLSPKLLNFIFRRFLSSYSLFYRILANYFWSNLISILVTALFIFCSPFHIVDLFCIFSFLGSFLSLDWKSFSVLVAVNVFAWSFFASFYYWIMSIASISTTILGWWVYS